MTAPSDPSRRSREEVAAAVAAEQVTAAFSGTTFNAKKARRKSDVYLNAGSPHAEDRARIAARKNCPPELLAFLSQDTALKVRSAVAANPSCPPDVLASLHLRTHQSAIASNPNTDPETLRRLYDLVRKPIADNATTRRALASNPNTPVDVLISLTDGYDSLPSQRPDCGTALAANPSTPTEVLLFIADRYSWGPVHVASNPACPGHQLTLYAKSDKVGLACRALGNPNCPYETLQWAIDDECVGSPLPFQEIRRIISAACSNPSLHGELLWEAARRSPDGPAGIHAAGDPLLPSEVMMRVASVGDSDARRVLAANPNATREVLECLASCVEASARVGVAKHPNTPLYTLRTLADDYRPRVKRTARATLAARADTEP